MFDITKFQEFNEPVEGSMILPMTGDETSVLYMKDVVYAVYGDVQLHLQILVPNSKNKPMMAPMPATFAEFGLLVFHTRNKIRPTIGKKKPRMPHPMLPESTGAA